MKTIKTMYESYKKPEAKSKLKLILISVLGLGTVTAAGIYGFKSSGDSNNTYSRRASTPVVRDYPVADKTPASSPAFLNSFKSKDKIVDSAKSFFGSEKKITKKSHGKHSKKFAKKHKKHRGHKYAKHKKHKHGHHYAHKKKHHKRKKIAAHFQKKDQVASIK